MRDTCNNPVLVIGASRTQLEQDIWFWYCSQESDETIWQSEESKENDQRSVKHSLPDQRGKHKEEFALCVSLEKRNSLKFQQRGVRLGIKNNILKVEHVTLKDSSTLVTGSFQGCTRHTSLRSNTGLPDPAKGLWREFSGFLMSLW